MNSSHDSIMNQSLPVNKSEPLVSSLITFWTILSVSKSRLFVASSKMMIVLRLSNARARAISWRCPVLKFDPPGLTGEFRCRICCLLSSCALFISSDLICVLDTTAVSSSEDGLKCTRVKALKHSDSLYSSKGSKFFLIVPEKSIVSYGIIVILDLRSCKGTLLISIPSIVILPFEGIMSRNNAIIRVDLPLPVLPTIAIRS